MPILRRVTNPDDILGKVTLHLIDDLAFLSFTTDDSMLDVRINYEEEYVLIDITDKEKPTRVASIELRDLAGYIGFIAHITNDDHIIAFILADKAFPEKGSLRENEIIVW